MKKTNIIPEKDFFNMSDVFNFLLTAYSIC